MNALPLEQFSNVSVSSVRSEDLSIIFLKIKGLTMPSVELRLGLRSTRKELMRSLLIRILYFFKFCVYKRIHFE